MFSSLHFVFRFSQPWIISWLEIEKWSPLTSWVSKFAHFECEWIMQTKSKPSIHFISRVNMPNKATSTKKDRILIIKKMEKKNKKTWYFLGCWIPVLTVLLDYFLRDFFLIKKSPLYLLWHCGSRVMSDGCWGQKCEKNPLKN